MRSAGDAFLRTRADFFAEPALAQDDPLNFVDDAGAWRS